MTPEGAAKNFAEIAARGNALARHNESQGPSETEGAQVARASVNQFAREQYRLATPTTTRQ
jgi:hypothetical protein